MWGMTTCDLWPAARPGWVSGDGLVTGKPREASGAQTLGPDAVPAAVPVVRSAGPWEALAGGRTCSPGADGISPLR
jgi:hypothetical protein